MRSVGWPLLVVILLSVVVETTPGQDPREAELAAIREQIQKLQGKLATVKKREAGLESDLERVKVEVELQEIELSEATAAHDLAASRAEAADRKIVELEASLVDLQRDLKRRLSGLYRLGRQGYLRLFLSIEADQQLLPAVRQLRFLIRNDQELLELYTQTRDRLEEERQRLERQRTEMAEWRQRESERRDQLVRLRERREHLLERVARERRQLAVESDRLQDKERKLTTFINSLLGRGPAPLEGSPITNFRGALDWPLDGEVEVRFGPKRDPRYRTEVPHNGIGIAPSEGEVARAIFPGEVLFASRFEGYGLMVVVHHPGRVFSLYAGLVELLVDKGDMVSLSQELGTVSDQLYFEVRRENQPEDPLEWLR